MPPDIEEPGPVRLEEIARGAKSGLEYLRPGEMG